MYMTTLSDRWYFLASRSDGFRDGGLMIRKQMRWGYVEIPFGSRLCPATAGGHSNESQSSMEYWWHLDDGTLPPNPWRSSSLLCTSWWVHIQLQNHGWQTGWARLQTPGCWRSSSCSLEEFCRLWWGEIHGDNCNYDSEQIYWSHSGTLQTPLHPRNTDVHLQNIILNINDWHMGKILCLCMFSYQRQNFTLISDYDYHVQYM